MYDHRDSTNPRGAQRVIDCQKESGCWWLAGSKNSIVEVHYWAWLNPHGFGGKAFGVTAQEGNEWGMSQNCIIAGLKNMPGCCL